MIIKLPVTIKSLLPEIVTEPDIVPPLELNLVLMLVLAVFKAPCRYAELALALINPPSITDILVLLVVISLMVILMVSNVIW